MDKRKRENKNEGCWGKQEKDCSKDGNNNGWVVDNEKKSDGSYKR